MVVDRLPKNENPFKGRSHCDNCKKTLKAIDLIPLFSYIALNGKCRYCKRRMGVYYPLVELVTGIMFALAGYDLWMKGIYVSFFTNIAVFSLIYYLVLVSILIIIFFTDLKSGIIPFNTVVFGVLLTALWHLFFPAINTSLLNYIFSAVGAFIVFLFLFLVTKGRGMGFGDVVYVFLMGLVLGFPKIILGMYIAFISGAVISLILIFSKKKKMRGETIPFGPFLVAGTIASLFWGDFLLSKALPYLLIR